MRRMRGINPRLACALAALAAGAALFIAFGYEWWGGLVPCPLCLRERWPYRVAIAAGVVGMLLPPRLSRAALVGALLCGLVEVAASGLHVGVEFGWWPSPLPECAAPHLAHGSIADMLRSMPATPSKSCEDMVFPVAAIPISFAQAGLLYALAFSAGVAVLLVKTRRRDA
jgi:disulfide bond formation protein DsbB